ncbi:MAG: type II toxin-antitoxin system RelB/DinJ family antitoxin [Slackia sp.]|nr:type II toxin-antitoxin system RelB/DinJ family antitoxin [Slackia sp.]
MGMLAVRIDDAVKMRGTEIMRKSGYTPSSAVQELFAYVVKNERMPFERDEKPDDRAVKKRLAALSALKAPAAGVATDEEIRAMRIEERYGIDVR